MSDKKTNAEIIRDGEKAIRETQNFYFEYPNIVYSSPEAKQAVLEIAETVQRGGMLYLSLEEEE